MTEKFWHVKNCNLFRQLTDEQIRRIETRSRIRVINRADPIYLPSQAADGVLLLVSGRVKLCHVTPEGKQSILSFIEPGEIFGELAIFDQGQREEYAEAVEKTQVVLIPLTEMQWLMDQQAEVSLGITKLIGLRRQRIERRLKNLLFRSNRERLVHLLLELVENYGLQNSSGIELKIRLSHQDLASVIGSTRESVTVLLGDLQSEKLISVARRKITILDLDRLAGGVDAISPKLKSATEISRSQLSHP